MHLRIHLRAAEGLYFQSAELSSQDDEDIDDFLQRVKEKALELASKLAAQNRKKT